MVKSLSYKKLTAETWNDFEALFGAKGACGGCWCQWWKVKRSEWDQHKGEVNRQSMKSYIEQGQVPGILAYSGQEPVAWCAVEPKDQFPVLKRSRTLKNIDDQPVWSVTCFFIRKSFRGQGCALAILKAAIRFVAEQGGSMLEGYPAVADQGRLPATFAWTGLVPIFEKAGFYKVEQPSASKVIMRYKIQ
jgi:GNAT superfamily N-acetyltransferase